jgi:hypothetical protein
MHVLFIDIWMTVSDYNTNPTVIILVGIGILTKCMFYLFLKNSLIIQEQNIKKNHKRVVVLYVIKNHVNLHKL